jgi:hypothetical protein
MKQRVPERRVNDAEAAAKVNYLDYLAAKVCQSPHGPWGGWNFSNFQAMHNLLNFSYVRTQ